MNRYRAAAVASALWACALVAGDLGDDGIGNGSMTAQSISGGFGRPNTRPLLLTELFDLRAEKSLHALPTCSAATNCEMQCTAYATGNLWRCVDENGTTVPVTQGSGGTTVTGYFGHEVLEDVTDAASPSITTGNDWDDFWTVPHTVVVTGHSTNSTAAIQTAVTHLSGVDGIYMRREGGWKCAWQNAGGSPTSTTATVLSTNGPDQGLGVYTCRKAGTGASSVYSARANGESTDSANWDYDPGIPTGGTQRHWRGGSAGVPWRGAGESITFYSVAKTDAQLSAIEAAYYGISVDDGTLLSYNRQQGYVWELDDASSYWPFSWRFPRVTTTGLHIEPHNTSYVGGSGSNWATDTLAAATWTAVGTPTTTSNAAAGPFFQWKNTNEADLIEDDDGAAFEGYRSVTSCGTALEKYTVSCHIKQGTAGTSTDKARLSVVTDGGGSANCDKTLTNGFVRYECTTAITGSPTYVRGEILVGDEASDTGSILVSQCQCDKHGWAASPKVNNTSTGVDDFIIPLSEASTWSVDAADVSVVFSLDYTLPDDTADNNDSFFLLDVANAGSTDHRLIMWYQYAEAKLKFGLRTDGAVAADTDTGATNATPLTAGQLYIYRARWQECSATHVNHYLYLDTCADADTCTATTLVGSDTNCDRLKPDPTWGPAHIGKRFNSAFGFAGHIARITVSEITE